MDFEKYYNKLPDFIKYNPHILSFFLELSKKFHKLNYNSKQLESQHELLNLLLLNCDIKTKGTLQKIQLLYVEFFRFFDNICRKYDIDYWVDFGTLLGAVRHGGFILWDDDIDVSILRNDYEKLIEVLPIELSNFPNLKNEFGLTLPVDGKNNYFKDFKDYTYFKDNVNYPLLSRFFFLEFSILEPYVKIDIFPKDFILEDKIDYYKKHYISTKYRFNNEIRRGDKEFYSELKNQNSKLGLVDFETNYFVNPLDVLELQQPFIFETNKVFPLKTIIFEGYEFKCPNDIDSHLKIFYGNNYMHIPKIIEHHGMIEFIENQFSSKGELNNKIDYLIDSLKDINDNF